MVMRTTNVKLLILTGMIMNINMAEHVMYRAYIHSRCSRMIGEKEGVASKKTVVVKMFNPFQRIFALTL